MCWRLDRGATGSACFRRSSGCCLEDRAKAGQGKNKNSEPLTMDWTGDDGGLEQIGDRGGGGSSWVQDII